MLKRGWKLTLFCIAGLVIRSSALADDVVEIKITTTQPGRIAAVQTQFHDPVYPRGALQENREGWVLIDFDIDADGRVQNAIAVDSVGGSVFELAAVNSVGRQRFRPAQFDNAAVFQGRNLTYVKFAINLRTRGSTRRFAERYNDVLDLIAKNQLERADALASSQFDDWPLNLHELTKLWSLRAQLALIQNNIPGAETALRRATANDGEWLEKPTYQSLLLALVHVEVETGQFRGAIESYERLVRLNPRMTESLASTAALIESLQMLVGSNRTLATDATISENRQCQSCSDTWSFLPLRDRFRILDVVGELRAVNMVCDNARVSTLIVSDGEWVVPPQFGECRIEIRGNPGTKFSVHQLPGEPQAH